MRARTVLSLLGLSRRTALLAPQRVVPSPNPATDASRTPLVSRFARVVTSTDRPNLECAMCMTLTLLLLRCARALTLSCAALRHLILMALHSGVLGPWPRPSRCARRVPAAHSAVTAAPCAPPALRGNIARTASRRRPSRPPSPLRLRPFGWCFARGRFFSSDHVSDRLTDLAPIYKTDTRPRVRPVRPVRPPVSPP